MKYTKIVATIGPVSCSPESIKKLSKAGMDIVRLNGSHNTLEWHEKTIQMVHEYLPMIPILLDIPGRKIRTIQLKHEPSFKTGDTIILTTDLEHDGSNKVPVNYPNLHEDISVGATIMADDGTLCFKVLDVKGRDIICRSENAGILRSRKGINVPNIVLKTPLVTERDKEMIEFATKNKVDFIGISFVESKEHIKAIKQLRTHDWPRIVSKIENSQGVKNMDEIIDETDAIMIDRGDLSVETNIETLALAQKKIIKVSNNLCKPVIVATEMLHTMISNPFPTKAEVSDISNSVLDGCAATMLSGETAVGEFAEEAVKIMSDVASVASNHLREVEQQSNLLSNSREDTHKAMGQSVAHLCKHLPVTKVIAITRLGFAARVVSSQNIKQPILAISDDLYAARSFNLFPGTEGIHLDVAFSRKSADHIIECLNKLWLSEQIIDEDHVLVIGLSYPKSGNRFNHIQLHQVSDLVDTLSWER